MDELQISYNRLIHLGTDIRNLLCSLKTGNSIHFSESLNLIINDFDSSFVEIQSLLPYFIQIPTEEQNQVLEDVKNAFNIKREKDFARYQKETEQYSQRFRAINEKIDKSAHDYNSKVMNLRDDFNDRLKKIDCAFVDKKILIKSKYNEKINQIDKLLIEIKKEQEETLAKEEEKIAIKYTSNIEQKNIKANEVRKAIDDINREKDDKSKSAIEKLQKLQAKHASAIDLLNHRHTIEMDKINTQQKNVQNDIDSVEERISTLKRRSEYSEIAFKSRILFTKNSLNMDHQLQMKECQRQIADTDNLIRNFEKMMEKVEKNANETIKKNIVIWQKRIDDEIMRRNKKLKEIEVQVKNEFEEHVNEKKERLKQLNYEISENQLKSTAAVAKVTDKILSRVALVQNKNKAEIDKLKLEMERIRHYLSKVQVEWESLRSSTHCIYDHKLLELRSRTAIQKTTHENKIMQVVKQRTPIPDTTDYMAILEDEMRQLEASYRQEEAQIKHEKMVQLKIKLEEERSRGLLSMRKQNVEEINILKETESHIKEQRDQVDKENRELTEQCKREIEDFTVTINHKVNCEINEVLKELDEKRNEMNQELSDINDQIDKVKEDITNTMKLIKQTKEAVSPELKNDEAEEEVRALFEEKKKQIQKSIDALREEVKLLKNTKNDLSNTEKRAQSKFDTLKHNLEAEKEKYLKEADRGKNEIEYKYKRLIEEQERILQKLQESWDSEVEDKQRYKEQLASEKERISSNQLKNLEKTDNEFRKKVTEIRSRKGKANKEIEDAEYQKFKEEEEAFREEIERQRLEFSKIEKYKYQDNQILIRKQNEGYQKELDEIESHNNKISDHIKELQDKMIKRLQWICPDCEKLESEIKDLKKTILDIVQKIHEMEKEDGNRQFTLTHFCQTTRALPRLKVPNEKAEVV